MCVYYAKFPNSYLKEIVQLGANYETKSTTKYRVTLRRTKPFHIAEIEDCIALFNLFAELLTYLVSGKSHVGYLREYENNPIHQIVLLCFAQF
jgi:hypothetical protein